MQDGKDPIITIDFSLQMWNQESGYSPSYQQTIKVAASNSAAAASYPPPEIPADLLQPGKI